MTCKIPVLQDGFTFKKPNFLSQKRQKTSLRLKTKLAVHLYIYILFTVYAICSLLLPIKKSQQRNDLIFCTGHISLSGPVAFKQAPSAWAFTEGGCQSSAGLHLRKWSSDRRSSPEATGRSSDDQSEERQVKTRVFLWWVCFYLCSLYVLASQRCKNIYFCRQLLTWCRVS